MRAGGLTEVSDPSARFVRERERGARARACSARWRARGRCSWRCRRWSRRPTWFRRGGSRTASTATASASCWPCSPATSGAAFWRRPPLGARRRLREPRRRRAGRGAWRRPRGRARRRIRCLGHRAGWRRAARSPASARSGSRASCATSRTPNAGSRRRRGSGSSACVAPVRLPRRRRARRAGWRRSPRRSTLRRRRARRARRALDEVAPRSPRRRGRPRRLSEPLHQRVLSDSRRTTADRAEQAFSYHCRHAASWGRVSRASSAARTPTPESTRDGFPGHRPAGGHGQHRPRPDRRADRHRRGGRARAAALGRHQARHRVLAGVPLPAREDGRRDHALPERDQDPLGQRSAHAGPDDPLARDRHPRTGRQSASRSRPTRS